jgi:trans-2-enoyl-CoA reductase
MRALRYHATGEPSDVLALESVELIPAPGQALCRVEASPIAPSDVLAVHGLYAVQQSFPVIAGMQGVGVVEDPGDTGAAVGQRLLFPMRSGAWASHALVEAERALPLPADIDPVQACGLRINPPTAQLLIGDLPEGSWLIQDPGSCGVGQYVIQLARAAGLKTVSVIRRPERRQRLLDLGADVVVEQGRGLSRRVREATGGAPILRALDAMGGAHSESLARCLSPGGELICYGATSRQAAQLSVGQTVFRDIRMRGFWLYRVNQRRSLGEQNAQLSSLAGRIQEGLKLEVAGAFGLDDWEAALQLARDPARRGRVVFTP